MSTIRMGRRLSRFEVDGGPYHWGFNCAGRIVRGPLVPRLDWLSRPLKLTARSMRRSYPGDTAFDYIETLGDKKIRWGKV